METDFQRQGFGTTPFPDWFLDRLMPRLRDVEWRLVCVLVRQTLGWQSGNGKPKHSDWLSHSQLRRRTGRSSSAISPAIEFLCRNRLVEVDDGQGNPLRTSYERRRHRGPLYFRLNLERLKHKQKRLRLKKRIQKSGTTINTLTKEAVVRSRMPNGKTRNHKSESIRQEWKRIGRSLPRRKGYVNSLHYNSNSELHPKRTAPPHASIDESETLL